MELVEFLQAQLDEDEAAARKLSGASWSEGLARAGEPGRWRGVEAYIVIDSAHVEPLGAVPAEGEMARSKSPDVRAHVARHDPARVLADVEAKRRIVELHTPERPTCEDGYRPGVTHAEVVQAIRVGGLPAGPQCTTLRLLALPYADHEDFREEWRP